MWSWGSQEGTVIRLLRGACLSPTACRREDLWVGTTIALRKGQGDKCQPPPSVTP